MSSPPSTSDVAAQLLQRAETEYDRAHARFEALDTKAGVALGFVGALLALTLSVEVDGAACVLLVIGQATGGLAAVAALVAVWPRRYPSLNLAKNRKHLEDTDPEQALFDLMDQRIEDVAGVRSAVDRKIPWYTAAIVLTTAAVLLIGFAAALS